jgi:hypothetical protein
VDLSLTEEDVQLLREVIESVISDMSPEIADTDNPEYRRTLRSRRDALRALLDKLGGTPAGSTS